VGVYAAHQFRAALTPTPTTLVRVMRVGQHLPEFVSSNRWGIDTSHERVAGGRRHRAGYAPKQVKVIFRFQSTSSLPSTTCATSNQTYWLETCTRWLARCPVHAETILLVLNPLLRPGGYKAACGWPRYTRVDPVVTRCVALASMAARTQSVRSLHPRREGSPSAQTGPLLTF
jgi:hypothetical protein